MDADRPPAELAGRPPPAEEAGTSGAGVGVRAGARLLDALIVGIPASALLAILGLPAPTIALGGTEAWVRGAVTGMLWLAYHVAAEGTWGRTVGKRLLGVRVVTSDGDPPSHAAATTRNLWLVFGLVPWVGGLALVAAMVTIAVTIARDSRGRGLHDRLAGTDVVFDG